MKSIKNLTTSIALTTYNGMPFLKQQLESFSQQTILPDELIICDDGSIDNSIEICNSYAKSAPFFVKVVSNKVNIGYSKNFEKVLSMCNNDIVFISDQDDVWYKNKIEIILKEFENSEYNLIIHDLMYCNSNLKRIGESKLKRISSYTNPVNAYVTGMATAVRNPFLKLCFPFPESTTYDNWIHRCATIVETKQIIPQILADYRRHETNVTSNKSINNLRGSVRWVEKIFKRTRYHTSQKLIRNNEINKDLLKWLISSSSDIQLIVKETKISIIEIIARLENINNITTQRIEIIKCKNIVKRINDGIKFLVTKKYNYFNGFRSFIKDVFYSR